MPGPGVTVEQKQRYPDVVDTFGQPHYDAVLVDGRCGRGLPRVAQRRQFSSKLCRALALCWQLTWLRFVGSSPGSTSATVY